MSVDLDQLLDTVSKAKTSEGGNYIRAGTYVLEVKNILTKANRKMIPNGIGEFLVHQVIAGGNDLDGKPVPTHQVGESVSNVIDLTKDTGPGNFKGMILGAIGETDKPGDPVFAAKFKEMAREVVGAQQITRGVLVRCEAIVVKKRNGEPFTKLTWVPIPASEGNDAESIKARRAKQGLDKAA